MTMVNWDRKYVSQSDIDNVLVSQKDKILGVLNAGLNHQDAGEYIAVPFLIQKTLDYMWILADLWILNRYSYKAIEILERIRRAVSVSLGSIHHRATKQHDVLMDLLNIVDDQLETFRKA